MSNEKFKYDFMKYNKYFVLRPNIWLILILFFLCKDIFLMLGVGATAFKGKGQADVSALIVLVNPIFFLSDLPALAVAYVASNRRPNAGPILRLIWKYGRQLVLLSASTYILLLVYKMKWDIFSMNWLEWLFITTNIFIIVYVVSSKFIKDVFNEFPT